MTDRNRDETSTNEPAPAERKRRQFKRLPKPLFRLLLILATIVVIVVVIVVAARGAIQSGEAADYQRYLTSLSDILKKSDTIGAQLQNLLTEPGDINRAGIQTKLDGFVTNSEQLKVDAEDLKAPKTLVDQGVHQFFLMVMGFRSTGMSQLEPALMNALDAEDTTVPAENIVRALKYLTNSDFLYQEVFMVKAKSVLTEKELGSVAVPDSQFLADPDLASNAKVQDILTSLRSSDSRQPVHGLALKKVVAQPDKKTIENEGTYNLTSDASFALDITVENQGNMDEKNIQVVVTLEAAGEDQQKVTAEIAQLKAKKSTTITVKGLNPTAYGEVATLKVKVSPVDQEKYTDNNNRTASVIFKL